MAKIYAPNKDYNGVSATVPFFKGVGETSDAYLTEWFKAHGYTVTEDEPENILTEDTPDKVEPEATEDITEDIEEVPEKPKRKRTVKDKAADAE